MIDEIIHPDDDTVTREDTADLPVSVAIDILPQHMTEALDLDWVDLDYVGPQYARFLEVELEEALEQDWIHFKAIEIRYVADRNVEPQDVVNGPFGVIERVNEIIALVADTTWNRLLGCTTSDQWHQIYEETVYGLKVTP